MRLRELAIDRLPGIDHGYRLTAAELDHPFVLIEGPNGSGKSSIGRALRALFWPEATKHEPAIRLSARIVLGDSRKALLIEREGRRASCVDASGQAVQLDLPAPQVAGCYVLGVRDLIAYEADDGESLRRELQRRLAGGYDLDAQLQELAPRARPGQHEARELAKALDHEGSVLRQQAALAREADALVELRRRFAALASARRRGEALGLAIESKRCSAELEPLQLELAAFPLGMELLDGHEVERLEEILEDRRSLAERRERVAIQRERLRKRRASLGGLALLSDAEAQRRRRQAHALSELASEYARARRELARAQTQAREAQQRLDPDARALAPFELAPEAVDEVASYVEDRAQLDAARRHAEDWRARLLATRPKRDRGASQGPWLVAWLAAASVALLALVLALLLHVGYLGLLALGVFLFELGRRARARVADALRQAFDARREHEVERVDAELDRVQRESESLDRRGRELHARLGIDADVGAPSSVELVARIAAWRSSAASCAVAEAECARVAGELEAAAEAIAAFLDQAGLAPLSCAERLAEIALDVDAQALSEDSAELGQALLEHVDATREVAKLEEQREDLESEWAAIEREGLALGERHEHLFASREIPTAHEALADEAVADGALADEALADEADVDGAATSASATSGSAADLAAHSADPREGELRSRVSRRKAWSKLDERARFLRSRMAEIAAACAQIEELEALDALEALPAAALLDRPLDELERELQRVEALEAERIEIAARIGDVEGRSRLAAQGDALECARAERDDAKARLADCRTQELLRAAKRFVLGHVRSEHRRRSQPALVESARRLFARFTRNAYDFELRDEPGLGLTLFAREHASGALLRLEQLSDGTRCQFWLALRLAFAFEAERGEPMPIVFDEALAHCDEERFAAIARALFVLANEGRQIVYLSSDRADAQRFERAARALAEDEPRRVAISPNCVDLAELRGLQRRADLPAYEIPSAPRLAQPSGRSLQEYARALGLAPFDPWAPIEAQHVYWLLDASDARAPETLHGLLERGLSTLGQLSVYREHARSPGRAQQPTLWEASLEGQIAVIEERARVFEAVLRCWRIGRARRVARESLAASGAVSDSFLDAVSAQLDEVAGRPDRLLDVLGDGAVPRFRKDKIDRLRDYFVEHGALDERPPLASDEIALRAVSELGSAASAAHALALSFAELCARSDSLA